MDKNDEIKKLEARIDYLEENRRFIQNSLEMALSLSDFHREIGDDYTTYQVYEETEIRVKNLMPFEACAFYSVHQDNSDFLMSLYRPEKYRQLIEDEMEFFIEKGFVAWAIRERRGVLLLSRDQKKQVLLHVIATHSRIRGMFVGVFPPDKEKTQDASFDLLSIILRNTANALGNIEYRERIKSEKELKESKERIESILFSFPTGIVIIDSETHEIIDANQKAVSMIGAPKSRIIGSNCRQFFFPGEDDKCPITDMGQTVDDSERELLTVDHEKCPIHKSVIPIVLDGRRCLIESFIDISERKHSEEERLQKEKLQGVIEIAGAVCHELNQPLQVIYGYSDIILMRMEKDNPDYDSVIRIKEQIIRIRDIIKKLMYITRYKTKKYLKGEIIDIDGASEDYRI